VKTQDKAYRDIEIFIPKSETETEQIEITTFKDYTRVFIRAKGVTPTINLFGINSIVNKQGKDK